MRVAINGFGRIGRLTFKYLLEKKGIEVIAINDLADNKTLAHLLKYDSVHGKLNAHIESDDNSITVNGHKIHCFAQKDPSTLPWEKLKIDVVLESTGFFRKPEDAVLHLKAGAKRVILSAPPKGDGIKTIVLGVNDSIIEKEDKILSNASCTTNCLAPMVQLLNDKYGIENGFLTTVHAYTANQKLLDAPHKDLRRGRAAAYNMVPTSTGATTAVGIVIPEMKGKLEGLSVRVPVPDGSLTDLTVVLKKKATVEEINNLFKNAANNEFKGIIEYNTEPIVSTDIIGNKHSCIFDAEFTKVIGNTVKILAWYDNEAGYSARLADMIVKI